MSDILVTCVFFLARGPETPVRTRENKGRGGTRAAAAGGTLKATRTAAGGKLSGDIRFEFPGARRADSVRA